MGLAGGWPDVIGAPGFIFLALHAGHNATFVTIGEMRCSRSPPGRDYTANYFPSPVQRLHHERNCFEMENCADETEKIWN